MKAHPVPTDSRRWRTAAIVAAVASVGLAGAAAARPSPASSAPTFTAYRTTADTGEPTIGWDRARTAAVFGAGTQNKRLTWNDATVPATMTVADAKATT